MFRVALLVLFGASVATAACGSDEAAPDVVDVVEVEAAPDIPDTHNPRDTRPPTADIASAEVRNALVNHRTTVIVAPGADLAVTFAFSIWSAADCTDCSGQILIATSDGSSIGCPYGGTPGPYPGVRDEAAVTLKAPAAPGTYGIRWKLGQAESCEAALAAYADAPATADDTLLEFLVQ